MYAYSVEFLRGGDDGSDMPVHMCSARAARVRRGSGRQRTPPAPRGSSQRKPCAVSMTTRGRVVECDVQPDARMPRSASVAAETSAPAVPELGYGRPVVGSDPAISRVLVVDDNAENRALVKATLDDEDIPVELAATGEDAIAAFVRAPANCVLLDIRMPGMDGITVCERLRALPEGGRVAIVFLTAQRDVDTFDRALRAGGDDFINKPFRPSDL